MEKKGLTIIGYEVKQYEVTVYMGKDYGTHIFACEEDMLRFCVAHRDEVMIAEKILSPIFRGE